MPILYSVLLSPILSLWREKQFRNGQGSMELFLFKSKISSETGFHCLSSNFMTSGCCFLFVIYSHNLFAVLLPKLVFLTPKRIYPTLKLRACFWYSHCKATDIQLALIGILWGRLSKREKLKGHVNLTCTGSQSHTALCGQNFVLYLCTLKRLPSDLW